MKYLYLSISIDVFVHGLDLCDRYSRLIIFQNRHSIVYKSVKCRHLIIHINNEHLQENVITVIDCGQGNICTGTMQDLTTWGGLWVKTNSHIMV